MNGWVDTRWIAGQGEAAQDAYRTAMELIPAEPPSIARARAVAGLAQILSLSGRFEEARTLADAALDLARSLGARDIEGHALNTRGLDRAAAGEVDEALADMAAAVAIAEEVGSPRTTSGADTRTGDGSLTSPGGSRRPSKSPRSALR